MVSKMKWIDYPNDNLVYKICIERNLEFKILFKLMQNLVYL